MILGPEIADRLVQKTFGFGKKADAPIPSEDEKKVHMPKTSAELQKWLKRARRKV
jgi:hypothetical protein